MVHDFEILQKKNHLLEITPWQFELCEKLKSTRPIVIDSNTHLLFQKSNISITYS